MASLLSKRCYVNAFETPLIWIVLKHRRFCLFKILHASIYFIVEHGSPVTRQFHLLKDKSCALMVNLYEISLQCVPKKTEPA